MSDNVKCHVQHTFIRVSQSCPGKTVRQILKKKKKNHVKSVAVLNSKGSLGLENRSPQAELTAMRVLTLALLPPKNYIAGNIRN